MLRKLIQRLAPSRDSAFIAADRLIAEGRKAEERGDLREACGRYREAVALAPGHPATHLNLGAGLEVAGGADGGVEYYTSVRPRADGSPHTRSSRSTRRARPRTTPSAVFPSCVLRPREPSPISGQRSSG